MHLQLFHITPELQPYIKVICSMEIDGTNNPTPFRVLPDTCAELFICYSTIPLAKLSSATIGSTGHSFMVSQMSRYIDVAMQAGTGCINVSFKAGCAYRFFDMPMDALTNTAADIGYMWKGTAMEMEERVGNASNNEERVSIIQNYLLQQMLRYDKHDAAVTWCMQEIARSQAQISVQALADKAGYSQRQLSRHFNNTVGLSPKEYIKVNRFIHSLQYIKKAPSLSLTKIAYESGYYDQAHFIHDCSTYAGMAPRALLQSEGVVY